MNALTLTFWSQCLAILGAEVALVVGLAAALQWRTRSAAWRRGLWQSSLLGLLALAAIEVTGVRHWLIAGVQARTETAGPLTVLQEALPPQASPAAVVTLRDVTAPPAIPSPPAPQPQTAWWPGVVWLSGSALLAVWWILVRLLFALSGRRRRRIEDPVLLTRVTELARRLGLRRRVNLLETPGSAGPVAFGILRPTVCLPAGFSRSFSKRQQEVMLAHELAHLASRDPAWYAFADALTVCLWWHPLVWWERRQLHAASETAADDASLLLEDGPDALAECLVAMGRQLAQAPAGGWLRIEGNGFRSSLGRRVTRLLQMDGQAWQPVGRLRSWLARTGGTLGLVAVVILGVAWMSPRQAGATSWGERWSASLVGLAMAAWQQPAAGVQTAADPAAAVLPTATAPVAREAEIGRLAAVEPGPPAVSTVVHVGLSRSNTLAKLRSIRFESIQYDGAPLSEVVRELSDASKRRDPENKGVNFILSSNMGTPDEATGQAGAKRLSENPIPGRSRREEAQLPVDKGLGERDQSLLTSAPTNSQTGPKAEAAFDLHSVVIKVVPALHDLSLLDLLEVMVKVADKPIKYSVEDYGVVISARTAAAPIFYNRFFRVDPSALLKNLERMLGQKLDTSATNDSSTNLVRLAREFFAKSGVDLSPPKTIFYNDRLGMLMVRATLSDLDSLEQALQVVNMSPPQVTIETKLCEVTSEDGKALDLARLFGDSVTNELRQAAQPDGTNASLATTTAILSDSQFRGVMQTLEKRAGVDILSAPKLTTLSGRQAQIKVADIKYVVTDLMLDHPTNHVGGARSRGAETAFQPIAEPVEVGPVVDLVPWVMADGVTIQLNVIATVREFLGYDAKEGFIATVRKGTTEQAKVATPLPRFRVRQVVANALVCDGQTVVLYGGSMVEEVKTKDKVAVLGDLPVVGSLFRSEKRVLQKKNLLVFVTPTLIDPAGNRLFPAARAASKTNAAPARTAPASR